MLQRARCQERMEWYIMAKHKTRHGEDPGMVARLPLKDDGDAVAIATDGRRELGDLHLDDVDGVGEGEFGAQGLEDAAADVLDELGADGHFAGADAVDVHVVHGLGEVVGFGAGVRSTQMRTSTRYSWPMMASSGRQPWWA